MGDDGRRGAPGVAARLVASAAARLRGDFEAQPEYRKSAPLALERLIVSKLPPDQDQWQRQLNRQLFEAESRRKVFEYTYEELRDILIGTAREDSAPSIQPETNMAHGSGQYFRCGQRGHQIRECTAVCSIVGCGDKDCPGVYGGICVGKNGMKPGVPPLNAVGDQLPPPVIERLQRVHDSYERGVQSGQVQAS